MNLMLGLPEAAGLAAGRAAGLDAAGGAGAA
jgi:hypothetical protein